MKFPGNPKEKGGLGTTNPFGHPTVKAQRDQFKGHAKKTVSGAKDKVIIPASRTVKGKSVTVKGISKDFNGGK